MKKSKKYTGYLLVAASCNSDYEKCGSCVVHIPEGVLDTWKERAVRVQGLNDDTDDLIGVEWLYSDVQFLTLDGEDIEGTPCWVKITDKDRDEYKVDDRIISCSMHITSRGTVWFQGYGKHSGIEYSTTDDINIETLVK